MQKLIALLGLAALASGCAGLSALPVSPNSLMNSQSAPNPEIHNQTAVTLQEANFVVVKTNLVGQAKGFSLLGLITIVPARFNKAMNQLYSSAKIETGKPQTLAHVIM